MVAQKDGRLDPAVDPLQHAEPARATADKASPGIDQAGVEVTAVGVGIRDHHLVGSVLEQRRRGSIYVLGPAPPHLGPRCRAPHHVAGSGRADGAFHVGGDQDLLRHSYDAPPWISGQWAPCAASKSAQSMSRPPEIV